MPGAVEQRTPSRATGRLNSPCVRLVVVEDGMSGLEAQAPADGREQTVRVAQNGGEATAHFALRIVRRILALEQDQRRIERAVLLLAPRFDPEATAARLLFARALMTHSAATNAGACELLLSTGAELHAAVDAGLSTLIDALTGDPGSCALPIAVHFQTEAAPVCQRVRSGVSFPLRCSWQEPILDAERRLQCEQTSLRYDVRHLSDMNRYGSS